MLFHSPLVPFFWLFVLIVHGSSGNNVTNLSGDTLAIRYLGWSFGVRVLRAQSFGDSKGIMIELTKNLCSGRIPVLPGKQHNNGEDHHQLAPAVFLSENLSDIPEFIEVLAHGDYPSEGLLFVTSYRLDDGLRDLIKNSGYARAFFHFAMGQDPASIERLQTFRTKDSLLSMIWHLDDVTGEYKRKFDFKGAVMTMLSPQNNWPYIYVVPRPDDPTRGAVAYGTIIDIEDAMSKRLNFTHSIYIHENDDQGLETLSGEFGDPNASYTGMIKELLDDKYDRTAAGFFLDANIDNLFDFSIQYWFVRFVFLIDVGRATSPDWTLFIRPFTNLAWLGSLLVFAIILAADHFASRRWCRLFGFQSSEALRAMTLVGWMCYLVTEIHWEGALTMFFTTEKDLPFTTIEQKGIAGMEEQIDRIQTDTEIIPPDFPTWLETLKKPGRFTFAEPGEVRLLMELYGVSDLNLQEFFPLPYLSRFAQIYPKRSPWKEACNIGYGSMMSNGHIDHIKRRNLPDKLPSAPVDLKEELSLLQTALVFIILGVVQSAAIVIFLGECVAKRFGLVPWGVEPEGSQLERQSNTQVAKCGRF